MQVNLVLFKPNGQRKDIPITPGRVTIGRRQDCHLRIPLVGISRQHCELRQTEQALQVRDLESSNGTFVNGQRVTEQVLSAGDRLTLGPVTFIVQIDGQPAQITPAAAKPAKPAKPAPAAKPKPKPSKAASEEDLALELISEFGDDEDDDDILEDLAQFEDETEEQAEERKQ